MRTPLIAALLCGCPPPADTGESAPPPPVPDLPTAGCGMVDYAWLPLDGMGAIVDDDEAEDLSMTSEALDFLLESYGVTQFSPLPYDVRAWRLRYATQDRGQGVEATMVLTLPDAAGESFPLVVFPHGTSGFTDACAPSAGGLEENGLAVIVASMGYAVAAPDYLGMNGFGEPAGFLHPYLVPEATAVATLDSARAAAAFVADEQPGAEVDLSRTVLWGGSEGGFAALWAERYAAQYLPEAQIAATVALVPPTDLTAIALEALERPIEASAGLVAAWVGQHSWYAAPGHDLSEVLLDPIAEALPGEMMASCSDFPSVDGATTLEQIFQPEVLAQAATGSIEGFDPWACYLSLGVLHGSRIERQADPPVLVVVSEADELVVASTVRDSIPILCGDGYDVDYLECAGADHSEGAVKSLPYQFDWVAARLAGEPLGAESCRVDAPVDCDQFLDVDE